LTISARTRIDGEPHNKPKTSMPCAFLTAA
jgi:hypothetical protein